METIRQATTRDAEQLALLLSELHDEPVDLAEAQQEMFAITHDPLRYLLVAELNGKIIGTIDLIIVRNITRGKRPWAIAENLVVSKANRKQGIAKRLIEHARQIAEEKDCYKIQGISSGQNSEATILYNSLDGVVSMNGWKIYLESEKD